MRLVEPAATRQRTQTGNYERKLQNGNAPGAFATGKGGDSMKLATIEKKAAALGMTTRTCKLTGGGTGLFISLEKDGEDGRSHPLPHTTTEPLMKYLSRYRVPYEYRGNYTSVLIQESETEAAQ